MPVFFKCKNCGQEHPCPLYFPDEKSLTFDRLGATWFSCPVTFKTAAYEKRNLFWIRDQSKPFYRLR